MRHRNLLILVSAAFLFSGCVPGVGWLPDSSGFVFTTAKGHLIAYNIKTNKQRVLLTDRAAATTSWPAVSPDGKQIALAQLVDSADKSHARMQIEVCDAQGEIQFRSEELKFAPFTGKDAAYATQVVWSPDAKQILLHGQGTANQGTGFNSTALFDLGSGKLKVWANQVPAYFGGSPVRPDGKGFLMVKPESTDYTWVEWSGKQHKLISRGGRPDKLDGPDDEPVLPWSALYDSKWDGTTATLTTSKFLYVIDTQKRQLFVSKTRHADVTIGQELIRSSSTLVGDVELLVLEQPGDKDGQFSRSGPAMRVVSRQKGQAALSEIVAPVRDCLILLNLAPDRNHAIIRVSRGPRGDEKDVIYVINNTGRLHEKILVKNEGGPSDKYEGK